MVVVTALYEGWTRDLDDSTAASLVEMWPEDYVVQSPGAVSNGSIGTGSTTNGSSSEDGADLTPSPMMADASGVIDPVYAGELPAAGFGAALFAASTLATWLRGPALASLRSWAAPLAAGTRHRWSSLPGPVRSALQAAGFVGTADVIQDFPGVPGESAILDVFQDDEPRFGGGGLPVPTNGGGALALALQSGGIERFAIGSWVANGVTFYRLIDGRLAVQNKKGRWKIWKPKKPIVLYSDGASSLQAFLRADRALDRQSKKLRKALDRRAPRRKSATKSAGIIVESGPGNVIRT